MAEHESKLYCKSCHVRQFGLKGYGYGGGAGTLASEAGSHTDGPSHGKDTYTKNGSRLLCR